MHKGRTTVVALVLSAMLAGCGGTGVLAGDQPGVAANSAVSGQAASTVVVTRTVVVTSTVFATVAVGTTAATTSSSRTSSTAATIASAASTDTLHAAHATPTPLPHSLAVADASTVTLDFLGALEKAPSGASSLQYLSSRLQEIVRSGHSVVSVIGIESMYGRYHADAAISRGGGRAATVRVTLTLASGTVQRLFTLIPEGGVWRIDDIADTSV